MTITIPRGYELIANSKSLLIIDDTKQTLILPDITQASEEELAEKEAIQLLKEYQG